MHIRFVVTLTEEERTELESMLSGGRLPSRKMKRAQILLAADRGISDADIAATLPVGTATVYRTKRSFVEEGFYEALNEGPRPGAPRKLSTKDHALLIATA